eukprot:m.191152 g.191152  ORF g.191152 m.191152 type:complete len:465 (-) comp18257_c0_seq1:157-1551(-)
MSRSNTAGTNRAPTRTTSAQSNSSVPPAVGLVDGEIVPLLSNEGTTQTDDIMNSDNPYGNATRKGAAHAPDIVLLSESEGGGFIVQSASETNIKKTGSVVAFDTSFPSLPMGGARRRKAAHHQVSIGAEHSAGFGFGDMLEGELQVPYSNITLYITMVTAAMIGALIRMEFNVLSEHDMYTVYPRLYANVFGCLLMGPLVMYKAWWVSSCYPVYLALGVGLCGSITSFSSWQTEATMALVHWPGYSLQKYDNAAGMIIGSMTIQMIGIATSTAALSCGMLCTQIFSAKNYEFDAPKPPLRPMNLWDVKVITLCVVIMVILISVNFGVGTSRHETGYTILFAPFGVLLRYALSRRYNQGGWFPWGTFAANMLATFITSITIIYASHNYGNHTDNERNAIAGVISGFCGCLSTVSTWVFELRTLSTEPTRPIRYALASIVSAQMILFASVGMYRWAHADGLFEGDN